MIDIDFFTGSNSLSTYSTFSSPDPEIRRSYTAEERRQYTYDWSNLRSVMPSHSVPSIKARKRMEFSGR